MILILILALVLRWYGINWDQGWHLHPDERMLIMVADRIHLFSQLNPDFFNYGSLPIYILRGTAQLISTLSAREMATYDGMLSIGRGISVALDIGTLILIYRTAMLLFSSKKTALLAGFSYAIAFFPIQNTHFFIVDNFLNFFMAFIIYLILRYIQSPHRLKIFYLAILTAAAVTTKATGIVLLLPVGLMLLLPIQKQRLLGYATSTLINVVLFFICFLAAAKLFMPYAFSQEFQLMQIVRDPLLVLNPQLVADVKLQLMMNSNPFIFPYTLQYVNTTPYIYYIKNIFIWGLGPFISVASVLGFALVVLTAKKMFQTQPGFIKTIQSLFAVIARKRNSDFQVRNDKGLTPYYLILTAVYLLFYLFYFLILGKSEVKFMRYMLPLYAPLCILAGFTLFEFLTYFHKTKYKPTEMQIRVKPFINMVGVFLLAGAAIWTLMFEAIYSAPHSRITASEWILQNIPAGSTIAVEHWDDRLPLPITPYNYTFYELNLYDPDTPEKWNMIHELLQETDYMIIASNRLYTPLTKLTDCSNLPDHRCYKQTADYYKRLFAGDLGFEKVAEFTSYPKISIGTFRLEVHDDTADESFTVYDHPKIMIFKKI